MRIPTFDPNENMAAYGEVSSAEQAQIIEELAWKINGGNAFNMKNAGVIVLGVPTKGDFLFSCKNARNERGMPIFPVEVDKQYPDGYWGIMVLANMSDGDDISGLSGYVRDAILLGKLPKQIRKIAMFLGRHTRQWFGGLKQLNEAGVYLISDYASTFVFERHDPVGAAHGFVRLSKRIPEKIELSQDVIETLGKEEVDILAAAFAWRIISGEFRGFISSMRDDIKDWSYVVEKLSLGKLSLSSAIEEMRGKKLENYLCKGYIPPKDHPSRKYVLEGERIALIAQMWSAYLQGYGLKLTKHFINFDPKAFLTPEFEKLIDDVCTHEYSDEEMERFVYRAGYLSSTGEDIISLNSDPKDFGSNEKRTWSWSYQGRSGLNKNRASKGVLKATVSSKAIDEALTSLRKTYIEDTDNIYEVQIAEYILNTSNGLKLGSGELASCLTENLTYDRWKLITSSRLNNDDYAGEGFCAIAADLIDMDEVDAIVVLRFNFNEVDPDKIASVLKIIKDAGVEHVCDYGGNFDVPQLDEFVIEVSNARLHSYHLLPKRTRIVMKDPGITSKKILDAMAPQGEKRVIENFIERINKVIGSYEPKHAEIALSAVCGKPISMPRKWEEDFEREPHESPLLDVLSPLAKFFPAQGYADIAFSLDAFKLWRKLLNENGLEISDSFPVGVDAALLEQVKDFIGVSSYFEALEAGVPLEDLLLEDVSWR